MCFGKKYQLSVISLYNARYTLLINELQFGSLGIVDSYIYFIIVCDLDAWEFKTKGKNLRITLWLLLSSFITLHVN